MFKTKFQMNEFDEFLEFKFFISQCKLELIIKLNNTKSIKPQLYKTGITSQVSQSPIQKMESIIIQGKVHFYEYMEVELLQQYIQKGISYFINALLNASPKLVKLRYFTQELALVINLVKDFYYLLKHNATYAQYFYGLQREGLFKLGKEHKLSKLEILLNAAVVTVIPYILQKIDSYYNRIIEQEQNEGKVLTTLQKLFTTIYPYLHMVGNVVQVLIKFRYLLFQNSKVYDLYYKATNATLMYIEEDQSAEATVHYPWKQLIKTPGLLSMLVGHKVLTWYFNQKNFKKQPSQRKMSQQPKFTSPLGALKSEQFVEEDEENKASKPKLMKNVCPICSNLIESPTVVKQTGHVYCYQCITSYVKENEKCPLTDITLKQENLQLIYSNN